MKANYNRDFVTVRALIISLSKINMLLYNQQFKKQQRACVSFAELIDEYADDYNTRYEGYGHEKALAESLKKKGISIRLVSLPFPIYQKNRERIRFYLGLTAKALLRRGYSKREIQIYIREFQTILARRDWTVGKARTELDEMLLKNINIVYVDGKIEEGEVKTK